MWGYSALILALLFIVAILIDALHGEIESIKFTPVACFMAASLIYSSRDWFKPATYDSQRNHSSMRNGIACLL